MNFTLDNRSGKRKFTCPNCLKPKTFTLYIDIETGEYLSDQVGKCDRINNCGHHQTPKEFLKDSKAEIVFLNHFKTEFVEPSYIDQKYFNLSIEANTLGNVDNFSKFLILHFGLEQARELISKYHIGKSSLWPGATVFWQMDVNGKIRTGKIMHYDSLSGKRIKRRTNWVHKQLEKNGLISSFNLAQCYFGEHLMVVCPKSPVAIVESEKTAIICSIYFPDMLWMASGSLQGISINKSQVLKGRKVFLFPDLKGLDLWQKKAKELRQYIGLNVRVFDWLEKNASTQQIDQGLDLADFLIQNRSNLL